MQMLAEPLGKTLMIRVATWNLDRSGVRGKWRVPQQLDHMSQIGAQIWVLTETHQRNQIPGYQYIASSPMSGGYNSRESAAAIWVPRAWKVDKVETRQADLAVCALVTVEPGAKKLLIYGTIIPYLGDGRAENVPYGYRQREAVELQTSDWRALRIVFPMIPLIVAGDFNITLHKADQGYGDARARKLLREGLEDAQLVCHTAIDLRADWLMDRDNIDHICVSKEIRVSGTAAAWPGSVGAERALSDHNGTYLDLHL